MAEVTYAKLFKNGRSQAVRLPREFRFEGDRVRIRREGSKVVLEPAGFDVQAWFAAMDSHGDPEHFMPEGREQPMTSDIPDRVSFD